MVQKVMTSIRNLKSALQTDVKQLTDKEIGEEEVLYWCEKKAVKEDVAIQRTISQSLMNDPSVELAHNKERVLKYTTEKYKGGK